MEPECPAGFVQFEGQSPDGQGRSWFIISKNGLLNHFSERRNRSKLTDGFCVPEVVDSPTGTWIDLIRFGKEEAMCYAGIPDGRFLKDVSVEVPVPPGKVFAIYVAGRRATSGQLLVTDYEWLEEDKQHGGFPIDHHTRFGRRLWPPK